MKEVEEEKKLKGCQKQTKLRLGQKSLIEIEKWFILIK